jgi:hypothetical protein
MLHAVACLKSKVQLRLASAAAWVLGSNSLVLAHTVKYYNQEATRVGLFTLHQASSLCKQTEPSNTRHQLVRMKQAGAGHVACCMLHVVAVCMLHVACCMCMLHVHV